MDHLGLIDIMTTCDIPPILSVDTKPVEGNQKKQFWWWFAGRKMVPFFCERSFFPWWESNLGMWFCSLFNGSLMKLTRKMLAKKIQPGDPVLNWEKILQRGLVLQCQCPFSSHVFFNFQYINTWNHGKINKTATVCETKFPCHVPNVLFSKKKHVCFTCQVSFPFQLGDFRRIQVNLPGCILFFVQLLPIYH